MKYFTKAWRDGELSDAESEEIQLSYWKHIHRLTAQLPQPVVELATRTNLHDGLFQRVVFDANKQSLDIKLRCGDQQTGYFDLDLSYGLVSLSSDSLETLRLAVVDPSTEVLYSEIDLFEDRYVHRLSFWPYREVDITFGQVSIARRSSLSRDFAPAEKKFEFLFGET